MSVLANKTWTRFGAVTFEPRLLRIQNGMRILTETISESNVAFNPYDYGASPSARQVIPLSNHTPQPTSHIFSSFSCGSCKKGPRAPTNTVGGCPPVSFRKGHARSAS